MLKYILTSLLILCLFTSCEEAGTGNNENVSSLTLLDPPAEGTNLPESFQFDIEYIAAGSDRNDSDSYILSARLWTEEGPTETLAEISVSGNRGNVDFDFDFPASGMPDTALIPYRIDIALCDGSSGKELCVSEDAAVYDEQFSGTWYSMGTKVIIENTSSTHYKFDFDVGDYVPDAIRRHERKSHNSYSVVHTHDWDDASNSWKWASSGSPPSTMLISSMDNGDLDVREEDGSLFEIMTKNGEYYSYSGDFCGKWWTDDVILESGDEAIHLWLSDNVFELHRKVSNSSYPLYEKGSVQKTENQLTLIVIKTYNGTDYVDPAGDVIYKFSYVYNNSPTRALQLTTVDSAGFIGHSIGSDPISFE